MFKMPTPFLLYGQSLPSQCPVSQDMWKKWERQQSVKKSSSTTKGPNGESVKGANKAGKVYPAVPSTPKTDFFSGRLRIAALEAGFSSFKTEIASMFASLMGRFTACHPPNSNTDESRLEGGVAYSGVFPSRGPADPPASQRYLTAREVSTGTYPSVLTGQRGQPADGARQPLIVDDMALTGQSSHLAIISLGCHPWGYPPWKWRWGRLWPTPLAYQTKCQTGSRPSLSGVKPPRDSPAPPWGPVDFQGRGKRQLSGRHRPSLWRRGGAQSDNGHHN